MNHHVSRSRIGRLIAEQARHAVPDGDVDLWPMIVQQLHMRQRIDQEGQTQRSQARPFPAGAEDGVAAKARIASTWPNPTLLDERGKVRRLRSSLELAGGVVALLVVALLVLLVFEERPTRTPYSISATPARLVVQDSRVDTQPWQGILAQPVNPDTLIDLPEFTPTELSVCGTSALHPEGKLLAIAAGSTESDQVRCNSASYNKGVEIRLFNLDTWAWDPSLGVHTDTVSHLTWSRDGERLYALTTSRERIEQGGQATEQAVHQLWIIDPDSDRESIAVPLPYAVHRLDVAPDGSALHVLGYALDPTERSWAANGSSFLAILDPETGFERARLELSAVELGWRKEMDDFGEVFIQYLPGIALAPDGERYYIARADAAIIDVINLEELRIEQSVPIGGSQSSTESTAVVGETTHAKHLVVSPDGRFLYVGHVGVTAVDTQTWESQWSDATANQVTLSPDGRWLYVTSTQWIRVGEQSMSGRGRLRVLDAITGQQVATLATDQLVLRLALYGDDRLYVAVPTADYHTTEPYEADEELVELVAYEVGTWRELARRSGHLNLGVTVTSEWLDGRAED